MLGDVMKRQERTLRHRTLQHRTTNIFYADTATCAIVHLGLFLYHRLLSNVLRAKTRGCVHNGNASCPLQDTTYLTESCLFLSLTWHAFAFRFLGVHNPRGLCGAVSVFTCATFAADTGASPKTVDERPPATTALSFTDTSSDLSARCEQGKRSATTRLSMNRLRLRQDHSRKC